ncbi:MAG TPA: DUF1152 domain-containing protein [Herpetosiphonaceae bacterium]
MRLNLPIIERLADRSQILLAGMGGGFDVFCGLPIYAELRRRGHSVHLANLSFSEIIGLRDAERLSPTLAAVRADQPWIIPETLPDSWLIDPEHGLLEEFRNVQVYFPELHLARWLRRRYGEEIPIWCMGKSGARTLRQDYRLLTDHLKIDALVLVDGGVDSLVRGDESDLGTALEDSLSLLAADELAGVPERMIACLGLGAELDMSYGQIFENIAALTGDGAFLGACALVPQMEAYQDYKAAVEFVHGQPFQPPSIINASVVSAAEGNFGDYHLTERTRGSRLWISPLMAQYWFFDLPGVARRNLFLPALAGTDTLGQAVAVIRGMRARMKPRPERRVELP